MKLSKSWTTVTPLSKTIALILFIALPFIGFGAGILYQKSMDKLEQPTTIQWPASQENENSVGRIVSPSPGISCTPKPLCLDATPKCLIAEPAGHWCQ